ncbi:hypothetical protein COEREDRAFT_89147 [Coemansia reversa NRRL 1564]|uniref:Uncharacterized protein n=1 Tax=Coemansia reversa (strain ATCC 12441 / NRRL 1564) TaxID=763665 RepID=A0A2G5B4F8_COERN|nr:hypothetical protein COEREDRAFT_89147 [Coemansia reversa NRRL 1564]|eukprot:PIA13933.1 hypothetical protein COEREDRAFT_89147 [Coemansia reversa NRRL 1564]
MHNPILQHKNINSQHSPLSKNRNNTETQIYDKAPAIELTKAANATTNHVLETTMKHDINHALEDNSVYKPENCINTQIEDNYDNGDDFMWPPGRKYGPRFPEQTPQQILNQQKYNYHPQRYYKQWYSWETPVQDPEENPAQPRPGWMMMQPVYWKHNGHTHKTAHSTKAKKYFPFYTEPKITHANATKATTAPTDAVAVAKPSEKQKLNASAKSFMPNVKRKKATNQEPNNNQSPNNAISTTETQCSCTLIPHSGSKTMEYEVFKPKDSILPSCTDKPVGHVKGPTNNTVIEVEKMQYMAIPKTYAEIAATAKIPHYTTKKKTGNMFENAVEQETDNVENSSVCQKSVPALISKFESSLTIDKSTSEDRNIQDLKAELHPSLNRQHNSCAYADVAITPLKKTSQIDSL